MTKASVLCALPVVAGKGHSIHMGQQVKLCYSHAVEAT
jgi:hypothetical protein